MAFYVESHGGPRRAGGAAPTVRAGRPWAGNPAGHPRPGDAGSGIVVYAESRRVVADSAVLITGDGGGRRAWRAAAAGFTFMPPTTLSAPPPAAPGAGPVYRAGTLTYTARGLTNVFALLLWGDVVFTLIDNVEPTLLPVILKAHGASNTAIGIIIITFNTVLQAVIMPPLGYYSDRLRTRWGRRIPILALTIPFVTIFLALTPFSPELARWAEGAGLGGLFRVLPVAPIVGTFALFVFLYRAIQTATNVTFFGLLRDVVPDNQMGLFLSLFRLFGAGSTFIINYWLLGYAVTHSRPIFVGIAGLNLAGFGAICWFVREGTYPPVAAAAPAAGRSRPAAGLRRAVVAFVSESYRHPVYRWTYFVRVCVYSVHLGLTAFVVFFPQEELHMDLDAIGKIRGWPMLVWVVIAYPMGRLIDQRGATAILKWSLLVITAGYALSCLFVIGPATYLWSTLLTGIPYWTLMVAQLKLTQEMFHPLRYSQLAGANTIIQSIAIAALGWAAGRTFDLLKGWSFTLTLPGVGAVEFGRYRLLYLMMAVLFGAAWVGVLMVERHRDRLGGRDHYVAPL